MGRPDKMTPADKPPEEDVEYDKDIFKTSFMKQS